MHADLSKTNDLNNQVIQRRLTALWALSETTLGGFLHAFKLPFTGLIVSSVAVLLIGAMAFLGSRRGDIIKATLIVILAKVVVSPHSPLNAHFAVLLQGLMGEILFSSFKKYFRTVTILFALITAVLSATQKIIVLTLLFGFRLWSALDSFFKYVVDEISVSLSEQVDFSFSQVIVISYLSVHLLAGIFSGFLTLGILRNISEELVIKKDFLKSNEAAAINVVKKKRKKKFWWKRMTGILLITLLLATAAYSYFNESEDSTYLTVVIILARSFGLTIVWYSLIAPFALKLSSKFFEKKKSAYSVEITGILNLIPIYKMIVSESYSMTSGKRGLNRYKDFLSIVLSNIIFYRSENAED